MDQLFYRYTNSKEEKAFNLRRLCGISKRKIFFIFTRMKAETSLSQPMIKLLFTATKNHIQSSAIEQKEIMDKDFTWERIAMDMSEKNLSFSVKINLIPTLILNLKMRVFLRQEDSLNAAAYVNSNQERL